jgi:hypothetical protein
MALDDRGRRLGDERPERRYMTDAHKERREAARQGAIGLAVAVGVAVAAIALVLRRR